MEELEWKLTNLRKKLGIALHQKLELLKNKFYHLKDSKVLKDPYYLIKERILTVQGLEKELWNRENIKVKDSKLNLVKLISKLDALSPLKTLSRGYSLIEKKEDNGMSHIISSIYEIQKGDSVNIRFKDGTKEATIT